MNLNFPFPEPPWPDGVHNLDDALDAVFGKDLNAFLVRLSVSEAEGKRSVPSRTTDG